MLTAGKDRQHAAQGLGKGLVTPPLPVQLRHAVPGENVRVCLNATPQTE